MKGTYKDLDAWKESVLLATSIYKVTKSFPSDEKDCIVKQLRRAAVSVSSNIAEGYGRQTPAQFAHFVRTSRGSLHEVETQLTIAVNLGYLSTQQATTLETKTQTVGRLINGLLRYLELQTTKKASPKKADL